MHCSHGLHAMKENSRIFADPLVRWMALKGFRRDQDAADVLGIDRSQVNKYRNAVSIPSLETFADLVGKMDGCFEASLPPGARSEGWAAHGVEEGAPLTPDADPPSIVVGRVFGPEAKVEWYPRAARRTWDLDAQALVSEKKWKRGVGPGLVFEVGPGDAGAYRAGSRIIAREPADPAAIEHELAIVSSPAWGGEWRLRWIAKALDGRFHAWAPGELVTSAQTVAIESVGAICMGTCGPI